MSATLALDHNVVPLVRSEPLLGAQNRAYGKWFTDQEAANDALDLVDNCAQDQPIHMNGRVFDPEIARFLSADPIIQAPDNLQSYNRYSYTLNNPLRFTDPSGFSWLSKNWKKIRGAIKVIAAVVVAVYAPYLIGKIAGMIAKVGLSKSVATGISKTVVTATAGGLGESGENDINGKPSMEGVGVQVGFSVPFGGGNSGTKNPSESYASSFSAQAGALDPGYTFPDLGGYVRGFGRLLSGAFAWLNVATLCGSTPKSCDSEDKITVYRGTNFSLERDLQEESGYIFSDAARDAYLDYTYGTNLNDRLITNAVINAYKAGYARHKELVNEFGGEQNLAYAQTSNGTEFSSPPRSMFSVTTDLNTARRFGKYIYSAEVSRSQLISSPVKTSTENEYFIRSAYPMKRYE